ncbi:MAG: hypothetical protein LLF76_15560 [Planctomycetaceae bacterium]|nr:hypothetical protein [Planctomycetaceae bacterium]
MKKVVFLLLFFICAASATANAIVPVFHFFNSFLVVPSLLLLLIVVLLEAVLLKLIIRRVRFLKHLWFALVINVISSVAGALLGLTHFSDTLWDIYWSSLPITLGVPFAVTVLTEYPAIRRLYKSLLSRKKAILAVLEINVISYVVFCFLITPFYLTGIMKRSRLLDQQRLDEWNHTDILDGESGGIYKVVSRDHHDILNRYDLRSKTWQEVYRTDDRECDIDVWDISKRYFVFSDLQSGQVRVVRNGSFEIACTPVFSGRCVRLKISPCEQYIAILEDAGEVRVSKKRSGWFYMLGQRTRLSFYQTDTGERIAMYERPILKQTLSWSPDSQKILFETLENDSILFTQDINAADEIYLQDDAPKVIGWYNLLDGQSAVLCKGERAYWNPHRQEILFKHDGVLKFMNVETKEIASVPGQAVADFKWSPGGKRIVGLIRTENPMWTNKYFLTVIDRADLSRRCVIDTDMKYSFVWISDSCLDAPDFGSGPE